MRIEEGSWCREEQLCHTKGKSAVEFVSLPETESRQREWKVLEGEVEVEVSAVPWRGVVVWFGS